MKPRSRDTAALQLALDNAGFSPGLIDGVAGPRTRMAQQLAQEAAQSLEASGSPWCEWQVPEHFLDEVALIPKTWLERSQSTGMWHETPLEKISETFHASRAFLIFLNPQIRDWGQVQEGHFLTVPDLHLQKAGHADHLRISISRKVVLACDNQEKILASFPCSIAAKKEKRPKGRLEVCSIILHPDYVFDPALFPELPEARTLKTKLIIPPGPNNPVGEMWIGLNLKGYGIHGTPYPEEIARTESHGCFRLTNWDAIRLGEMIRTGTPVAVEP